MMRKIPQYLFMQKLLLLILIAFCGALSWVGSKYALREISPWALSLLRYVVAVIVTIPFWHHLFRKSWKNIGIIIAITLGIGVNSILYAYGIEKTNIWVAQVIYLLTPLITLVLSYFFLHEVIKKRKIFGMILTLIGAGLIFFLPKFYWPWLNVGSIDGNILIVLAVLCYCSYLMLSKRFTYTSMEMMLGGLFGGLICALILVATKYIPWTNPFEHLTWFGMMNVLMTSIIGTVIFYFLVQKLLAISSPFFTSFGTYFQLIFSSLLGYIFFDEYIGLAFLFGSILTIAWVYIINKQK